MKKKVLLTLITSATTISMSAGIFALAGSNEVGVPTRADNDYTLTIDASNKSNFVQDGDVYRGTFKTDLGNDIVFRMKSAPSTKEGVALEMTSINDYLINETPLRGVTRMDVTGHYLNSKGELRTGYALYVYYLADLDMANLDKDSLTNSTNTISSVNESDHTYVVNTGSGFGREGSAYYYIGNKDYFYSGYTWVIDSVKYYFSCESTKTYVSVTSSDSSLGEVSIDSATFVSSRYTVVANGTSVTIHAKKLNDFADEKLVSFKGWRLNGSEEYVSTSEDYTFTTVQDGSYKFVADFDAAETELFDCGSKVPLASGYYHTYVYSAKVEKYYAIEGVSVDSGEHTNQTLNTNELFIERHENVAFHTTSRSYFKLNRNPKDGWGTGTYITDDQYEKFDPAKVQAVIFYLAMDESDRIDELSSSNGTFTTYSNLQDPLDGNKAMSKVVWTGFTSDEANVYVPQTYRDADKDGTLWIKRMKVVYR